MFAEPRDCSEVNSSPLQAILPDSLSPVSQLSLFIDIQNPKATLQSPFLILTARSCASMISIPASVLIKSPSKGDYVGE